MTPRLRFIVGPALLIACAIAGCAGPEVRVPQSMLTPIATTDRFAKGLSLLSDPEMLVPGDAWQSGDRALFGIALDLPSGDREWYVRMTLREHPAGPASRRPYRLSRRHPATGNTEVRDLHFARLIIVTELFDHNAKPIMTSSTEIAEPCARFGLYDWITSHDTEPPMNAPPDELARVAAGWLFLTRMPRTLQGHEEFRPMLMALFARPSLWSILVRGELSLELDPRATDAIPTMYAPPTGGHAVSAYRLPIVFRGNDRLMLHCELLVTEVVPPLGACGGVVAADAWNPRDPARRAAVRLLGLSREAPVP